jgi:hypothetical protein
MNKQNIIIYNTSDGKSMVKLSERDGNIWLTQNQIAELFDTSKPNISMHAQNITNEDEIDTNSLVKYYLTSASDDKSRNYL